MAFLQLRGVTKTFNSNGHAKIGAGLPVLRDINLSI